MNNRQELRFIEETQAAFNFLVKEYLFTEKVLSTSKVRYESKKVYIDIIHSDYDFEILITFGRLNQTQPEQLDFTLFLRLMNPKLEKDLGERIADSVHKVRGTVKKISKVLRDQGKNIIKGDDQTFDRMKSVTWWQFRPEALKKD